MSRRPSRRIPAVALAAVLAFAAQSHAERIIKKGNVVIEGQIIEQTETKVRIKTPTGIFSVNRADIVRIEKSAPGTIELTQADDAIRRENYDDARALLQVAKDAGADPAIVEAKLAEITGKEQEAELRIHGAALRESQGLRDRGQFAKALGVLKEVEAQLSPDSSLRSRLTQEYADLYLAQARSFRDTVNDREAMAAYKRVTELDATRYEPFLELGMLYSTTIATESEAIDALKTGIALAGESLPKEDARRYHLKLAELLSAADRHREAFEHFLIVNKLAVQRDPRLQQRIVAECRDAVGQTTETALSQSLIDRALEVKLAPDLLDLKARIQVEQGKTDEAMETLRKLIAAETRFRMAHYNLARLTLQKSDPFEARRLLEREVELFPDNYDALCLLGDLALQRDDFNAAEEFYLKANRVDSDRPRAQLGLARAARNLKKLPEARRYVQEVLARLPSDLGANLEMGRILRDEEKYEDATTFFTQVLRLVEEGGVRTTEEKQLKADALIARGEVRLITTGANTANGDFNLALEVIPGYATAYFNIGQAYRAKFNFSKELEDLKEAEKNLLKSRELDPKNPAYALSMGILYHQSMAVVDPANKQEYLDKAIANYQSYIDLGGGQADTVEQWITECKAG